MGTTRNTQKMNTMNTTDMAHLHELRLTGEEVHEMISVIAIGTDIAPATEVILWKRGMRIRRVVDVRGH